MVRATITLKADYSELWEVYWSKENKYFEDFGEHPTPMFLEEDGLKLSIVVGTVEWYSTIGLKYELDI